jgi:CRP/FNR family cyclic AMP-dependent transcriptional regulator
MNDTAKIPPIVRLKYKKGELIIKQGDYGISIYKIIRGKVRIFSESGDREVPLATLGRGEIFGEMTFLNRGAEARTASVKAAQDSELEIWHPGRLSSEYAQMPHAIQYIVTQILERLIRMNKLVAQITAKKQEEAKRPAKLEESGASQRRYYRKKVDLECIYRPVGSSPKLALHGKVKDISMGGLALEVRPKNALNFSHEKGDKFHINTVLPNGKEITVTSEVLSTKNNPTLGTLFMGMEFSDVSEGDGRTLGFFMRA